jgi:hypothetical protein
LSSVTRASATPSEVSSSIAIPTVAEEIQQHVGRKASNIVRWSPHKKRGGEGEGEGVIDLVSDSSDDDNCSNGGTESSDVHVIDINDFDENGDDDQDFMNPLPKEPVDISHPQGSRAADGKVSRKGKSTVGARATKKCAAKEVSDIQRRLVAWVKRYYAAYGASTESQSIASSGASSECGATGTITNTKGLCPPLYFQHHGHSRTIIGNLMMTLLQLIIKLIVDKYCKV